MVTTAISSVTIPPFNPSRWKVFILLNQPKGTEAYFWAKFLGVSSKVQCKGPNDCHQMFLALSRNKARKMKFGERTMSTTKRSLGLENFSWEGGDAYLFNLKTVRYYCHWLKGNSHRLKSLNNQEPWVSFWLPLNLEMTLAKMKEPLGTRDKERTGEKYGQHVSVSG